MELDKIRTYVRKDVEEKFRVLLEPTKMQVMAQRYGKACQRHGMRLSDFIADDKELILKESSKGTRLIVPKAKFLETFPEPQHQINFWRNFNVSLI